MSFFSVPVQCDNPCTGCANEPSYVAPRIMSRGPEAALAYRNSFLKSHYAQSSFQRSQLLWHGIFARNSVRVFLNFWAIHYSLGSCCPIFQQRWPK